MQKVFLLLVFLSLTLSATMPTTSRHEFHLSRCMIEYKEQNLQITLHIFIDDLETALAEQGAKGLFIGTERETDLANTYIKRYLEQRFLLKVNQSEVTYQYLGKETSEDLTAVWCYLEVKDIQLLEEIMVDYSVLTEIYDDQKNIVSIKAPNQEEAYFLFTKNNTSDQVQY